MDNIGKGMDMQNFVERLNILNESRLKALKFFLGKFAKLDSRGKPLGIMQ